MEQSSSGRPILNGEDEASNSSGIKIVSVCSTVDNIVIKYEIKQLTTLFSQKRLLILFFSTQKWTRRNPLRRTFRALFWSWNHNWRNGYKVQSYNHLYFFNLKIDKYHFSRWRCEPEEIYCDVKLEPVPEPETIVDEMDGNVDFSIPDFIPSSIFDQKELTEQ